MIARKSARDGFPRQSRWALCALLVTPCVSHAESLPDAWAMALQVASRPLARTRIRQSVVLAHAARSTLTMPARALAQCIREQFTKG
jgi:hypothetical protein